MSFKIPQHTPSFTKCLCLNKSNYYRKTLLGILYLLLKPTTFITNIDDEVMKNVILQVGNQNP